MRFRAAEVAEVVGGQLVGDDIEIDGARHDSREITGGELFVPLVDPRDGHDFIGVAIEAGAAAYFTAHEPVGGTAIRVADPARALALLGAHARRRLPDRVVGITGSVGKTSCKDLASAAIGRHFETTASLRSFNNEYGVPLTLVNASPSAEAAIIEMGARGLRHIADLCAIADPTVGVVTTVDAVHTELFGDIHHVAMAKGELIEHLPRSGPAVLNDANPLVAAMAARAQASILRYGSDRSEVQASKVVVDDELRASFLLHTPWGDAPVRLAVRGEHHVGNALAAASAALAVGVGLDEAAAGLGDAELSPWRMDLRVAPSGARVLNDAYNAGPASMEAALRALVRLDAVRHLAVLGPMAELGDHSAVAHRRIADVAAELGIQIIAVAAPEYDTLTVEHVADQESALAAIEPLRAADAVLVKGSRVAGLERLAQALVDPPSA
jgi:UDP-N-acetylmuramoyl-tripeptide--D-alanyl-D-alanine ligase